MKWQLSLKQILWLIALVSPLWTVFAFAYQGVPWAVGACWALLQVFGVIFSGLCLFAIFDLIAHSRFKPKRETQLPRPKPLVNAGSVSADAVTPTSLFRDEHLVGFALAGPDSMARGGHAVTNVNPIDGVDSGDNHFRRADVSEANSDSIPADSNAFGSESDQLNSGSDPSKQ